MEKESNSEGGQLPPKILKGFKKQKVLFSPTLSSMMERVVERAVETKFQPVLPTIIPPGPPRKATQKPLRKAEISSPEEDPGEDLPLTSTRGDLVPEESSPS